MKYLIIMLFGAVVFTGCKTERHSYAETMQLPDAVRSAMEVEIGTPPILSVQKDIYAGDFFYDIDYLSGGSPRSLKIRNDGLVMRKQEWVIQEAAGSGATRIYGEPAGSESQRYYRPRNQE